MPFPLPNIGAIGGLLDNDSEVVVGGLPGTDIPVTLTVDTTNYAVDTTTVTTDRTTI